MQKKAIIISLIVLVSIGCFVVVRLFTFMSHDVLESFGTMEQKFQENNVSSGHELEDIKNQISEKEFKQLYRVALEVESSSNRLYNYIEVLKTDILEEQNMESETMDYSKMDKPSNLLFENNAERGKTFVQEIELHKKNMLSKLENFSYKEYDDSINSWFNTINRIVGKDWLEYEFKDFPVIATYTKLTSMQSDIRESQLLAYHLLLKE